MQNSSSHVICTRCVMDTSDPMIHFNSEGQCSHCTRFDERIVPKWLKGKKARIELEKQIDFIKSNCKGKQYDTIIGLSGGVDSSYLAVKLKEWGLNPLAVHVDAGWNSELAVKNIELICKQLKIELVTHVVDWEQMRDMQVAFLRSHVANQDTPQDHAYFAILYKYAIKSKIKYLMEGRNFATESVLPTAWGYNAMDATHLKDIQKRFGELRKSRFPLISPFNLHLNYPFIKGMKKFSFLNYISYNKKQAISELENNFGWRYYGGKHYESTWTKFFQSYYLPQKFGYDKRKAHLSSLILSGEISRETALEELKKPLYNETELMDDKKYISKKLSISLQELEDLIEQPADHYTNFKNGESYINFMIKYRKLFKSLF